MLNYVRAEFYKLTAGRRLLALGALLLGCELLLVSMWAIPGESDFASAVGLSIAFLGTGLVVAIPLAWAVCAGGGRQGTLKNEISFGVPRAQIYLGKLLTALLAGLALAAAALAFYLGMSWLLCSHGEAEAERVVLGMLGFVVLCALPLWIGMLALSTLAFLTLPSNTMAAVFLFLSITLLPSVFAILMQIQVGPLRQVGEVGEALLLTTPFLEFTGLMDWGFPVRCWAVGMGWTAASTGAGLALFYGKEL